MLILGWVTEVYKPPNFLGFKYTLYILSCQIPSKNILSCQMKICIIQKRFVIHSGKINDVIYFLKLPELFSQIFNGSSKLFFQAPSLTVVSKIQSRCPGIIRRLSR